jgi:carbon monoxide dehydrogenase subunit G
MPSATYQYTISIDAAPPEVWDGLQEPEIWSTLGPVQKLWDPRVEDGILEGFQWSTDIGGVVYQGTGTTTVKDRPERFQLVLDTSEMAGTITVDLSDGNPGGTNVTVTVELRSKGILSSVFFPVVSRAIGDGLPEQVEGMAGRLGGSGEPIVD